MNTIDILNEKVSTHYNNKEVKTVVNRILGGSRANREISDNFIDSFDDLKAAKNIAMRARNFYDKKGLNFKRYVRIFEKIITQIDEEKSSSHKRTSNERIIKTVMNDWMKKNSLKDTIEIDFKGTKLKEFSFSDLKRDELMTISGLPSFKFEAKKTNHKKLFSKEGVLFAEARKKYSNLKKKEILSDTKKTFEVIKHNEKINIDFSKDIIEKIKKELGNKNSNKPYLLIGGDTPESIKVIFPNEYWIDVKVNSSYPGKRVNLIARAKPTLDLSKSMNLTQFLNKMLAENINFSFFIHEILNG